MNRRIRLKKPPKYRNTPTAGSASKREAKRLAELRLLEKAGEIVELRTQVPFELVPAQYINGKCVERAVKYIADFTYKEVEPGEAILSGLVVEDTKGFRTPEYVIKRKLMLWVHGIRVREV